MPEGDSSGFGTNTHISHRHRHRHRDLDVRAGSIEAAIPKLRHGSYLSEWLLERRRRAERALTTVVAACYLFEVSTQRIEKLVQCPSH